MLRPRLIVVGCLQTPQPRESAKEPPNASSHICPESVELSERVACWLGPLLAPQRTSTGRDELLNAAREQVEDVQLAVTVLTE